MIYKFSDLIEFAKVQRLNDLFYAATGIPGAVIDLQGTIITCSGWLDVCTKFHRVNAETVQQCVESDTVFANQVGVGQKYTVYTCGNGLVVAASPIAIGGEHVANFITSQFLFQPPDKNSFVKQAKRFGFDETAYMEAVRKIPVIDEARLQPFLEYFSEFAAMLGEMGLKQLRQLEAAAALQDSEQRWATTLSSIGDAVIATDTHGRITFMNGVAEKLTGWALAEAVAKPVTDVFNIIDERTRRAVDNPVRRVLQKGMIAGLANHTLLLSRDGREIPIDDSAAPIRDSAGNIMGVVLVFRDITERRRVEKELLRAKEEWEFTFDSMPDMIAIIDDEHRTLRVNEAMARRLGRKAEECVGLHCYETVHGLSAPPSFCPHSRSLRDGSQHTEEITEDSLGGGCFLVSTTPLQVPGGQIMRTVHVARDITERKAAEEALRESQTRMNRAQEMAHLGSWELDLMNNRLSWSDEVYRIFGLQPQEFSATYDAFLEAVHPEDREAVDAAYSGSLREGRDTYEIEHRVVRRSSGEIRIVHEKCEHFRDDTGRIVKSVGMVHDITERKRVEQELREARLELERKVADRTAELRRSETYLSEAQRLTHTGSWARSKTGEITYLSEEVFRIFGLDPQDGLPSRETMIRRVHPDDLERAQAGIEKSIRDKRDMFDEYRILLPEGTVKHIQVIRHPVLNEAGEVEQLLGTVIDITERKRAEEVLRQSEAYLRESQKLSRTGSWARDAKTLEAVYWSEELFRLFGFDPQQGLPTRNQMLERIHPEDRENFDLFERVLNEKANCEAEYRIVLPHGAVKHAHSLAHPVLNDKGEVVQVMGTLMDITERKRSEEALRLAGVYNRSLIEASLDPLVTIDPEGRISDVNAATEQVTGYARSELIGTDFSDYFTEPEKARTGYRQVFTEGLVRDYELSICHRDGRITPVIYNASVYRDEAGKVIGVFAAARDITERKETLRFFQNMDRINQALQGTNDLEQMMRDVLDTMLLIFDSDRAWLVYPCDPEAASWRVPMERTKPEYPGAFALASDIPMNPGTRTRFLLITAAHGVVTFGPEGDHPLTGGIPERFGHKSQINIALYPKTGKPWVLGMQQCSYPRFWTQDERKLLGEIARRMGDVLTSLLAHRDLRESAERHRVTLQTAMDGFFRTDMQGRILEVNEAYCRMSGYSEQELLTMAIADVEAVHTAEMIAANIRRFEEVGPNRFESVYRRKDGSLFDVEISAQYQPIAGGQIVVFVRDITERKQAQEALQNLMADLESRVEERTKELSEANESLETANKELESFSYSVSHDLRAPLRAIDGFSMMVLKDFADKLGDEGTRKLTVIRTNTQQMGRLIDDLLAFSRLGRKELVTTRLDMEALVQSVWRELSLLNPERRIQYSVNTLPPAQGDQALIKEVMVNLLSNAIKFTKYRETSIVVVGAYLEEGRNVYFVKDNGVGFDMKYYDKLFGVFQRLHSTDEFEGTGVGLAIVERIIHRHGGRVWAEGTEGEGATFYFTLTRKE